MEGKKEVAQLEQWQQTLSTSAVIRSWQIKDGRRISVNESSGCDACNGLREYAFGIVSRDSGRFCGGATSLWDGGMGTEEKNAGTDKFSCPCSIFGNKPCIRGDYVCRQITLNQII